MEGRPGKRRKKGKQKQCDDDDDENTQLLKELIENLRTHHSDVHSTASSTNSNDCKKVLRKMKSILPVIVDAFIVKSSTKSNYISLVLDIFRMLISKEVCDFGAVVFDHGEEATFLQYIFHFLRLGIEIDDRIREKLIDVIVLMCDLLYVEFLTDRYVCILRDLVTFLSDSYVVLEALRTTSSSSSSSPSIILTILGQSNILYKSETNFDIKTLNSCEATSRCIYVLESVLSRTIGNGGAQFCEMHSIKVPLWNSIRRAIKTTRITSVTLLELLQTLINCCHVPESLLRVQLFTRILDTKIIKEDRKFKLLESLLDDETFDASSNLIDAALPKLFFTSSNLSCSSRSIQFGSNVLVRTIQRFGLWNSHLNMLTPLMVRREFHEYALQCVRAVSVSEQTTSQEQQQLFPVHDETQLRNTMKLLYIRFTRKLAPSHDVQLDENATTTLVQEANRMNFALRASENLDTFSTHVAKVFLQHAIRKNNLDIQALDTILVLLHKSYDLTRQDDFITRMAKKISDRILKNNKQQLDRSVLLTLLVWPSSLDDLKGYGHELIRSSMSSSLSSCNDNIHTITCILVQWIASSPSKTQAAKRSRVALNHIREMPLRDAVFAIGRFVCASSGCCSSISSSKVMFDDENETVLQCRSCDMLQDVKNDVCSSGVVLALFPFLERALSSSENEQIRVEATKSLGRLLVHVPELEISTQSRSALTFLNLMFSDNSSAVREAATSQIRLILIPQVRARLFPVLFPGSSAASVSSTSQNSTQSASDFNNLTEFIRQIGNHLNFNNNDDILIRGIANAGSIMRSERTFRCWTILKLVEAWCTTTRRVLEESDDDALALQIASHDSFKVLSSKLEIRQEDLLPAHASDLYVHIFSMILNPNSSRRADYVTVQSMLYEFVPSLWGVSNYYTPLSASKFVESGLEFVLASFLVNDSRDLLLRVVDLVAHAEYDVVEDDGLQSHLLTKILQPNMAHIACDFLTKYSPEETQSAWKYLLEDALLPLGVNSLRKYCDECFTALLFKLVWKLGGDSVEDRSDAVTGLTALSAFVKDSRRAPSSEYGGEPLLEMLRFNFLMIHAELTKKINSRGEERRRAMRCLEEFLFLLASCCSGSDENTNRLTLSDIKSRRKNEDGVSDPFVSAVMSIALHALMSEVNEEEKKNDNDDDDDEEEYVGVGIVESLIFGMSWSALRKALSSFVVTLVQCGENGKEESKTWIRAVGILHHLIVECKNELEDCFAFIPNISSSAASLSEISRTLKESRSSVTFEERVRQLVIVAEHESVAVRRAGLKELRTLLQSKDSVSSIERLMLGSGPEVHDVVRSLYGALLRLAREESDKSTLVECAACLGELGAVDPSRLRLSSSSKRTFLSSSSSSSTSTTANEEDDNTVLRDLAVRMLEIHLVGALRQRNTDAALYQRIAFAIQETLKFIYRSIFSTPGENSSSSTTRKTRFPTELETLLSKGTLQVVRPYWSTSYQMNPNRVHRVLDPTTPSHFELFEFESRILSADEDGDRYREWALRWAKDLCARVGIAAREQDKSWNLFRIAEGVLSLIPSLASEILPLVAWRVLRYGNESDVARLRKEIRTVLTSKCTSPAARRCMQTVFEILDHLVSSYNRERRKKGRRSTTNSMTDEEIRLKSNVHSIKLTESLMAAASFRCDAVTRALRHWESHLRSVGDTKTWSRQQLCDLQRIYERLDEPDGIIGIATVRPGLVVSSSNQDDEISTMWERIVEYESSGDWSDAMACYEYLLDKMIVKKVMDSSGSNSKDDEVNKNSSVVARRSQDPVDLHSGIVRCLLNDGHLASALSYVAGVGDSKSSLSAFAMDAAWQLERWDVLKSYHETKETTTTTSGYAAAHTRALLCLREAKYEACEVAIREARLVALQSVAVAVAESYSRAYPAMLRLHALRDIECALSTIQQQQTKLQPRRLRITTYDMSRQELIAHSRVLRRICGENDIEGQSWLQAAELARKSRRFQYASKALLNASAFASSKTFAIRLRIERAELLYDQGQIRRALLELEPLCHPDVDENDKKEEQARALLLHTEWQQRSGRTQGDSVIKQYRRVLDWRPNWARAHFVLGNYYDWLLMQRLTDEQGRDGTMNAARVRLIQNRECQFLLELLNHYGRALECSGRCGNTDDVGDIVYRALPRLLTLWLEFGRSVVIANATSQRPKTRRRGSSMSTKSSKKSSSPSEKLENDVNDIIERFAQTLPAYMLYTALPQLVASVGHGNDSVWTILRAILVRILQTYTNRGLWAVMGVSFSVISKLRERRAKEITSIVSSKSKEKSRQIDVFTTMFTSLNRLARNTDIKGKKIKVNIIQNRRSKNELKEAQIVLPLQRHLLANIPTESASEIELSVFSQKDVWISSFRREAEVMSSKERPKKIYVIGNDGKMYPFLCKAERRGDLRKDSKMMEFSGVINRLLHKDPEGRRRKLRLRTYRVVCLSEDCGLIEWVRRTAGYRTLVRACYESLGHSPPLKKTTRLKAKYENMQKKIPQHTREKITKYYQKHIKSHFPLLFNHWFLKRFPEATAWFQARLLFARSCAVWSMVGHIVGLGDRHGENIMLDQTSGECVHVDFDCLFDKGLSLQVPEIVPFRLTSNMVEAFGVMGYEGVFRGSCEHTLRVLRSERQVLLSVLEAFVHDPLVEWKKNENKKKKKKSSSISKKRSREMAGVVGGENDENDGSSGNSDARRMLRNIDERLRGMYNRDLVLKAMQDKRRRSNSSSQSKDSQNTSTSTTTTTMLPLSIEGQVQKLIEEATDDGNLCKMYIGWMPFL